MIPEEYKPLITKLKVLLFILFIVALIISNIGEKQEKPNTSFPKPDPTKGEAWGYDFKKEDYRYYEPPTSGNSIAPVYRSQSNTEYEFDEDDARDLLDMYID